MASTATSDIQTVRSSADKVKMALSAFLVLAGCVAFYFLRSQGAWVQWGVVALALVLALGLTLTSDWGKTFIAFCRDAWKEVRKVVWPQPKTAWQLTGVVVAFVIVMSLFLMLVDWTLSAVVFQWILGWSK